jgi:exopolysaccharide biosynthesis polyprenyl glycosylphosphotransferase
MQGIAWARFTRRREMLHIAMLVVFDSIAMTAAFEIGRALRASSGRPFAHVISESHFVAVMAAISPLWVVIFALCGLYRVQVHGGRVSEVGRVIAAVAAGVMLLISVDYYSFKDAFFPSHSVPLFALLVGIPLVVLERQLVRGIMRTMFGTGRGLHNVILIGTGPLAARIAKELTKPKSGYRLLAAVGLSHDHLRMVGGAPVFATLESAVAAFPGWRIDEIVQAEVDVSPAEATRLMDFANDAGVSYRFVPDKYDMYAAASRMTTLDGLPVMELRLTSLEGWGAVGKRVFDILGSMFLIVVFSPLLVGIVIAQKVTEPGAPIFYFQKRVGFAGRQIRVIKFRSMIWKYCTGPDREFKTAEEAFTAMGRADLIDEFQVNQKIADDPRVSKLGAFLRRTSLDELPQLFNALTGELSLVGPRPITQQELDRYGTQASSFLALKPGITGLWQVYGRSSTTYEERVKLDVYYVENWSLGMDVSILARTLVSVAARKGAV